MKTATTALLTLAFSIFAAMSAFASGDPPKQSTAPPPEKSSDTKKDTDNGLGDLFTGLAGQSLKVFMNPDLLKQIPGNTPDEKSENVKLLLNMIEGNSLPEKGTFCSGTPCSFMAVMRSNVQMPLEDRLSSTTEFVGPTGPGPYPVRSIGNTADSLAVYLSAEVLPFIACIG